MICRKLKAAKSVKAAGMLLNLAALLTIPAMAGAQTSAPDAARSTRAGIYTKTESVRGSELYALNCVSCHTAASHTSPAFVAKWQGRRLSELFDYMRDEMPKNDPGSLTRQQYLLLLAYLLKMNGMPAGRDELPGDSLALTKLRIDLKPDSAQR